MADRKQVALLKKGAAEWNHWRSQHTTGPYDVLDFDPKQKATVRRSNPHRRVILDLTFADLRGLALQGVNLSGANMRRADLSYANLRRANLSNSDLEDTDLSEVNLDFANLSHASALFANLFGASLKRANIEGAVFHGANMYEANLERAKLSAAELSGVSLFRTNLKGATLEGADLSRAVLVETDLRRANLNGCRVYGVSAWNLKLKGSTQDGIIITRNDEATIEVDRLEVAQFIYLLLNNSAVRTIIETITSKVVLILGRFTPSRKAVLASLRDALRKREYVPIIFDFDKPASQTTMETVATLAGMSRFVIADLTDAKSVLQELRAIVPERPSLPVQPLLLKNQSEPGMIDFFRRYPWFLPIVKYGSEEELLVSLERWVLNPVERWLNQIKKPRSIAE